MTVLERIGDYLKGKEGEKSSKRLAFIFALFQLCTMSFLTITWFLWKDKFALALELLTYFGVLVLIMGGFVTSEVLKDIKKGKIDG